MKVFSFLALLLISKHAMGAAPITACGQLEQMLFSSQLQAKDMDEAQFQLIDQNLKAAHSALCESDSSSDYIQGETMYYPNGQIATADVNNPEEPWYYPDGTLAPGDESMEDFLETLLRGKAAAIAGPFAAKHKICAPGCGYVSWGIWGDEAHKKRKSCHNSGDAIDIHAITCGGKTYAPPTKKFLKYIGCMKKYFGTVYGNKDHKNHVHIQLKNCRKVKG